MLRLGALHGLAVIACLLAVRMAWHEAFVLGAWPGAVSIAAGSVGRTRYGHPRSRLHAMVTYLVALSPLPGCALVGFPVTSGPMLVGARCDCAGSG